MILTIFANVLAIFIKGRIFGDSNFAILIGITSTNTFKYMAKLKKKEGKY